MFFIVNTKLTWNKRFTKNRIEFGEPMVLILDDDSEQVAYRMKQKKSLFRDKINLGHLSNQMPSTDQITEITPYLRNYF